MHAHAHSLLLLFVEAAFFSHLSEEVRNAKKKVGAGVALAGAEREGWFVFHGFGLLETPIGPDN